MLSVTISANVIGLSLAYKDEARRKELSPRANILQPGCGLFFSAFLSLSLSETPNLLASLSGKENGTACAIGRAQISHICSSLHFFYLFFFLFQFYHFYINRV
ncbi:Uncharacterized protein TCM_034286 [Theobroma cacao]|uniref:Uncharacterized protein n=1 Tax=Theobroma cacao TaxID=3641 RepID=A0A061FDX9_THECC|nr:Uncharacterized protein TCM_034286 [Theobroma cacao]